MLKRLHKGLTFFLLAAASGAMPYVTTAGCDTANGSFNFFRDDDEGECCGGYDDYYYEDYYYDDYYYVEECDYYGDCY